MGAWHAKKANAKIAELRQVTTEVGFAQKRMDKCLETVEMRKRSRTATNGEVRKAEELAQRERLALNRLEGQYATLQRDALSSWK